MASVFVFEDVAVAENDPDDHVEKRRVSDRRIFVRKHTTVGHDTDEEITTDTVLVGPIPKNEPVLVEHITDGDIRKYKYQYIEKEKKSEWISKDPTEGEDPNHSVHYEIVSNGRHDVQVLDGVHPDDLHIKLDNVKDANYLVFETDQGGQTRIPLPHAGVSASVQRISAYMMLGSLVIFAIGLIGAGYVAHRIAKPLSSLAATARRLGEGGSLGLKAPDSGAYPEIRQAVEAFNAMSVRLAALDRAEREHRRQEHMSELGEIARGLAHTIRNPLNTLGLSLEQMAALSADREQSRELVESSRKQIRRIDQWIRSFLALASEGKGERDALDIGALVEDVVLEAIQDCMGRVKLDLVIENGLPRISGVAPELRAVVQALVVNAVEASIDGAAVWIRVERNGGQRDPDRGARPRARYSRERESAIVHAPCHDQIPGFGHGSVPGASPGHGPLSRSSPIGGRRALRDARDPRITQRKRV